MYTLHMYDVHCTFSSFYKNRYNNLLIKTLFSIIPLPNITEWPSDSIINYESFIGIQEYDLFACIQSNDSHLIKFIEKFLLFKPKDRISCKNALPYFNLKKEKPNAK
ncbi:hypothetical protein A3Q56_07938 [Intoshia linei]|uniref:Protein kinase domain-containing protein n=1 Tax=Intoshia linei TaxID=1819745 RepID=A0A177ASZ0_9BILA|nr:hypothetical protein A3Q56_07938 [Intoshia linei]